MIHKQNGNQSLRFVYLLHPLLILQYIDHTDSVFFSEGLISASVPTSSGEVKGCLETVSHFVGQFDVNCCPCVIESI